MPKEMSEGFELIWVIPRETSRVCAHEVHVAHPGGVAWVAGSEVGDDPPKPVQVARTPFINRRLGQFLQQVFPPQAQSVAEIAAEIAAEVVAAQEAELESESTEEPPVPVTKKRRGKKSAAKKPEEELAEEPKPTP